MKYFLGFNIGNTNTKLGIFKSNGISAEKIYTYKTSITVTSDELGLLVKNFLDNYSDEINEDVKIEGIAFSSVVQEVNEYYHKMTLSFFGFKALEIGSGLRLGIKINYDNPLELGADRIANAVAAYNEYGKDCLIIDLGTANTFNVIHRGEFAGGLIGPGIGLAIEALAEKTSRLSRINFEKPDKLIATNTINAIKSGFFYGYMSMINGIIAEIEKLYNSELLIILTGGFSKIIDPYLEKKHILDPLLTMKGIKYLYDLNKSPKNNLK